MKEEKQKGNLQKLKELIDIIKGRKDVKTRLQVLTDPENLDTMTVLSKEQAHFLSITNWLVKVPEWGGMFTPMNDFAQSYREPNISIGGGGRKDSIEFVRAINEMKTLLRLGETTREKKES